jgi:alpha-tubulin suppressor-like RCC1 family protein
LTCKAGYAACPAGCCPALTGVVEVGAGSDFVCARLGGGTVVCWGNDDTGQLGNGVAGGTSPRPVPVQGLAGATGLGLGVMHACAITGGKATCWGAGSGGQLGNGASANSAVPVPVAGLSTATALLGGLWHTCALGAGGVQCWGANGNGELGIGTYAPSKAPGAFAALAGMPTSVGAGMYHGCAVVSGTLQCWGDNQHAALGRDPGATPKSNVPLTVPGLSGVAAVAAGGDSAHTCVLTTSGGVKCWGFADSAQIGDGSYSFVSPVVSPVDATGLTSGVAAVAVGRDRTCAVLSGGGVKCWGFNGLGQLGDGTQTTTGLPVDVVGLAGVKAVACGFGFSCALMPDTTVKCWGENAKGQLGDGTTTLRTAPVTVLAP